MQIDLLNPKAGKLIQDLADLKIIAIRDTRNDGFNSLLEKFRAKGEASPISLEEITKEVETVRAKRYAKAKG